MTLSKIIDFLSDTSNHAKNIVSIYDQCIEDETYRKKGGVVCYIVVIAICAFIIGKMEIYDF
jgi:hypothetical protein